VIVVASSVASPSSHLLRNLQCHCFRDVNLLLHSWRRPLSRAVLVCLWFALPSGCILRTLVPTAEQRARYREQRAELGRLECRISQGKKGRAVWVRAEVTNPTQRTVSATLFLRLDSKIVGRGHFVTVQPGETESVWFEVPPEESQPGNFKARVEARYQFIKGGSVWHPGIPVEGLPGRIRISP